MRTRFLLIIILASAFFFTSGVTVYGQPGRREPPPNQPNTPGSRTTGGKPRPPVKPLKPKAVATASVTITASPPDTVLLMNGQQVEGPTLTGLKPGAYVLTARRVGFNEESRSITLMAGENAPITIQLYPVNGRLSITPNVNGAEITVRGINSADKNPRTFRDNVAELNLTPGEYEIAIAKEGYRAIQRTITIEPAGSVYLEPQLSALPIEKKTAPVSATMSMQISPVGKYFLVSLAGGSEDAASSGLLDVVVDGTGRTANKVSGLLTGLPCQVDLVPIDNVRDYSIAELPEASNGWKRVAIRVRPRDDNRPLRFGIRWSTIASNLEATGKKENAAEQETNTGVEPGIARRKVSPNYPMAARTARIGGVVVVMVEIDEKGKVVSAKATEGPAMLRQAAETAARQWEFQPARKNGLAIRSSQRLEFNFQP